MLAQSLSNFAKVMHQAYPSMNRGGCGVFAVHMAKRLQHIVPTRIKLIDYSCHDLDKIRQRLHNPLDIQEWYDSGVCFVHLIVEFDYNGHVYHFDSEGLRFAKDGLGYFNGYELSNGFFTIEEVSNFTAKQHSWNTVFNREHIPVVKRKVKNLFTRHINHQQPYKYQIKN